MHERLSIHVAPDLRDRLRPVLATLPLSFSSASAPDRADVVVLPTGAGSGADAITTVRGALLVPSGTSRLDALPKARTVLVATPWRQTEVVHAAAPHLRALLRPHAIIELSVVAPPGSSSDDLLLAQLGLLRALGVPARGLRVIVRNRSGHEAVAELGAGVRAVLGAVLTTAEAPRARVELIDAAGSVLVEVPSEGAAPSSLLVDDDTGVHRSAAPFESADRTALRTLHRLVLEAATHTELPGFVDDLDLLEQTRS